MEREEAAAAAVADLPEERIDAPVSLCVTS